MVARNREKYVVKKSTTSRYKFSAVPSLQRLLNKEIIEKKLSFKRLVNGIKATQTMKKKNINDDKDPSFRVNYVCKVDVIT